MLADGNLVAGVQRVSGGKAHSASRLRKDTQILAVSVSEEFQMQNVKIHGGGGRFTTGTVLGVGCRPPKKDRVLVTGVYVLSNISPYRVRAILVTSLLRLGSRNIVTLMGIRESS
jgi:hypothetical protein